MPTLGETKPSKDGTKVARWNGEAWDIYDRAELEGALKQGAQTNAQNFEVARQQAGEVAAQPEYQQMVREQGAEGRGMMMDAAKSYGPSVVASMATGGVGGAIPALGRGMLGMATRAAGQGVAEYGRQAISGEEVSHEDAGLSAGLSAAADTAIGGVGALFKGLARKSPGVGARLSERELGSARKMMVNEGLVADKAGVKAAYNEVNNLVKQHGNDFVDLKTFKPQVQGVIDEMERRPAGDMPKKVLTRFKNLMKQGPGSAPFQFDQVEGLLGDINAAISSARSPNEKRLLTQAKNAVWQDLEQSPVAPEIKTAYQAAVRTARENFTKGELGDAIEAGVKRSNVTGKQIINPKSILERMDDLKSDPSFVKSFKPGQLEKVEKFFVKMTQELRGHSPEGTAIVLGSGGGFAGSQIGAAMGAPAAGAAAGAAVGVSIPALFTKIAMNDKSAELVLRMFATGKPIAQPILVALANAGSAATIRGE